MKLFRVAMMALVLGATSCELFIPPTKTDHGELYSSGDPRYDNFFEDVHKRQVAALSWTADESAARKPVISSLGLQMDAADWQIVSGTREHRSDPNVVRGAEDTIRMQHDRATRLRTFTQPLEDLASRGQALIPTVRESFRAQGEDKVREVRNELNAAVDVMHSLASRSRDSANDADDFSNDLKRSLAGQHTNRETPPVATASASASASASTLPKGKTPDTLPPPKPPKNDSKPKPDPDAKPDAKPEPKPEKPPDEVFNP